MTEKETPKVSVCMITYNHEPYIAQAIEGVLMQETDFPYELVIGEDCSTDNTRKICEEYAIRYPDKIRLFAREQNLGISRNFIETLKACNGEYIALCEGDDYWISSNKLAAQVRFLDLNPDFSGVTHSAFLLKECGEISQNQIIGYDRDCLYPEDILGGINMITASHLFRNSSALSELDKIPDIFDWVLLLVISDSAPIKVFHDVWSVYRIHGTGWSAKLDAIKTTKVIGCAEWLKEYFSPRYSSDFDRIIAQWTADRAFINFKNRNVEAFQEDFLKLKKLFKHLTLRKKLALMFRWFKLLCSKPMQIA